MCCLIASSAVVGWGADFDDFASEPAVVVVFVDDDEDVASAPLLEMGNGDDFKKEKEATGATFCGVVADDDESDSAPTELVLLMFEEDDEELTNSSTSSSPPKDTGFAGRLRAGEVDAAFRLPESWEKEALALNEIKEEENNPRFVSEMRSIFVLFLFSDSVVQFDFLNLYFKRCSIKHRKKEKNPINFLEHEHEHFTYQKESRRMIIIIFVYEKG